MRSMGKDWTFKSYSARDDDAYHDFMLEIDEHRVEVDFTFHEQKHL